MQLLRKPRLIPLLATIAVMALFAIAVFVSRPGRPVQREVVAEMIAPPALPHEAPPADAAMQATTVSANVPPPSQITPPPGATDSIGEIKPVEVSLPKLAYAYTLGFRLDGSKIAEAQESHRALCERMGPSRCQLLAMRRGEADDAETRAHLKVRVASNEARVFSDEVTKTVAKAGGRAIQTSVVTEDVSKQIVDAVARIRQREMLVARLTEILRTRRGTVTELVEAERSVAAAQEELDQTRGWLTELRGRVAMSDFDINYQAIAPQASPEAAQSQLGEATLGSGLAFLIAIRSMLTVLIYLIPWLILLVGLFYAARWLAGRRKRDTLPPLPSDDG